MFLRFFPLLWGVPIKALAYKEVRLAQYLMRCLLEGQLFMIVLFFLMVFLMIFLLTAVVLVQKSQKGIAKGLLMIGCVFQ